MLEPMACHVIRLLADTECGACSGDLPAGYAVITDEIEHPVFQAVCTGCQSGLPGIETARKVLAFLGAAGRRTPTRSN